MSIIPPLPLDIFNLIIDSIYSINDSKSLRTLSLVSKRLCRLSQPRVFRKFTLDLPKMKQIYDYTGDGSQPRCLTVLSYVRELRVEAFEASSDSQVNGKYLEVLRLFTRVLSLHLTDWYFQDFDKHHVTHLLGHFGAAVTKIWLESCFVDSEVLIFLTSLFPLVDELALKPRTSSELETYRIQDADRSRCVRFRGELNFSHLRPIHDQFLEFIGEHCSAVDLIRFSHCWSDGDLQELFDRVGGSLLSVYVGSPGRGDLVSLSFCPNLRTLWFLLEDPFSPDLMNWLMLCTVTSPHLEEVAFAGFKKWEECPLEEWAGVMEIIDGYCDTRSKTGKLRISVSSDFIEPKDDRQKFEEYVSRVFETRRMRG